MRIGAKPRDYTKNQMDIFELKNAIAEIKNTTNGFKRILDMVE